MIQLWHKGVDYMLNNIEVLCHSSIRMDKGKIIYVDPFHIEENYQDADIILITHLKILIFKIVLILLLIVFI